MKVIEVIDDLRHEPRAGNFWAACTDLVACAEAVLHLTTRPCTQYDFPIELSEVIRLWNWIQKFRNEPFNPPLGKEIHVGTVKEREWTPISGTHRAAALYALEKPVPALLIERPVQSKCALNFSNGMWKWTKGG